jgi:hypothetical protein
MRRLTVVSANACYVLAAYLRCLVLAGRRGRPGLLATRGPAVTVRADDVLSARRPGVAGRRAGAAGPWRIPAASVRTCLTARGPDPVAGCSRPAGLRGVDGEWLRQLREARGWAQLELARRARLSLCAVSSLQTGHHTSGSSALPDRMTPPPSPHTASCCTPG